MKKIKHTLACILGQCFVRYSGQFNHWQQRTRATYFTIRRKTPWRFNMDVFVGKKTNLTTDTNTELTDKQLRLSFLFLMKTPLSKCRRVFHPCPVFFVSRGCFPHPWLLLLSHHLSFTFLHFNYVCCTKEWFTIKIYTRIIIFTVVLQDNLIQIYY